VHKTQACEHIVSNKYPTENSYIHIELSETKSEACGEKTNNYHIKHRDIQV
jgi:hypothetical protein